ncbi:transcriptional regulator [Longibacter salinarum]|uniref:Transcriptional regulator n=1 Tax=Longibacter salinarum TaxID=1850348 RepID=A0A2A8CU33_9BACT|nr:helix-turn-helix domain-containing protein [Longibacter salinarum]PEN10380.1 transcriptional regulator [Longibacter salinarum]
MPGKIYTVSDLCERLQLHPDTVRDWITSGRLEAFKVGRRWRIPEDALVTSDVFDPAAVDALA